MTAGPGYRGRSRARRTAVQALYQWQATGADLSEIERQFFEDQEMRGVDAEYFQELVHKVPSQVSVLDGHLRPCLDRPLAQVDPVERAILRIGAYELALRPEIPWRAVVNEAVELAKTFGAEEGHKFVNAALDRLARTLRAAEIASVPPRARPRRGAADRGSGQGD